MSYSHISLPSFLARRYGIVVRFNLIALFAASAAVVALTLLSTQPPARASEPLQPLSDPASRSAGVQIIGVATGGYHTCALTSDHAVQCWGADSYGQLGDGTTILSHTAPVHVVGLSSGVNGIVAEPTAGKPQRVFVPE